MSPSFHIPYNSIFDNHLTECFFIFSPSTAVLLHVKPASNALLKETVGRTLESLDHWSCC